MLAVGLGPLGPSAYAHVAVTRLVVVSHAQRPAPPPAPLFCGLFVFFLVLVGLFLTGSCFGETYATGVHVTCPVYPC